MEIEHVATGDRNGVSLPVAKYFTALKEELHENEPENLRKFLHLLQHFQEKRIDHIVALAGLKQLFEHKPHLFHGFKNLLKGVGCVEREQTKVEDEQTEVEYDQIEVADAQSYLFKLKDYFCNDQRFQTFMEVLAKFNWNEKTKDDVYQTVFLLLGSDNEMFEEFRKFYGPMRAISPPLTEPSGGNSKSQDGCEDRNRGEQDCEKSNLAHKTEILAVPQPSCKRKRIQMGDISVAKPQQEVRPDARLGFVNNEMDRADKAKSRRRNGEVERERINKPSAADDELVPEHPPSKGNDSVAVDGSCGKSDGNKNPYEDVLFKVEDDRYEFEMLQAAVASAAGRVEKLMTNIECEIVEPSTLHVEDHLTASNLRCIEEMYGDYGLEMIDILRKDAATALPVILTRLEKKKMELSNCRPHWERIWIESTAVNYRMLHGLHRT